MNDMMIGIAGGAFLASDLRTGEALPASDRDRAAFDTTLVLAAEHIAVEEEGVSSEETQREEEETPPAVDATLVAAQPCALPPLPLAMLAAADVAPAPVVDLGAAAGGDPGTSISVAAPAPASSSGGSGVDDAGVLPDDIRAPGEPVAKDAAPQGPKRAVAAAVSELAGSGEKDEPGAESLTEVGADPRPSASSSRTVSTDVTSARVPSGEARASGTSQAVGAVPSKRGGVDVQAQPRRLADTAAASLNAHAPVRGRSASGSDADKGGTSDLVKAGPKRETRSAERLDAVGLATPATPDTFAIAAPVAVPMETVKTMAAVTVPAVVDGQARLADRDVSGGIRAAEAAGHRRVLAGEAHGRIVVPELGNVEVRAIADDAKVDVHVQADESHARHVILAHAPELSAHVQREVPEARIHVDGGPSQQYSPPNDGRASADLGRHQGESRREASAGRDPEAVGTSVKSVGVASDLRHRARVRIVL